MTEILKKGPFTYYCIEEDDAYRGLYFWYDDDKMKTTSYQQIEGTLDFIVRTKNIHYVRRKIRHYLKVKGYAIIYGKTVIRLD